MSDELCAKCGAALNHKVCSRCFWATFRRTTLALVSVLVVGFACITIGMFELTGRFDRDFAMFGFFSWIIGVPLLVMHLIVGCVIAWDHRR